MAVPEYRVLEDSFYEPNHVLKGSIIRTTSAPGPHLQPLNAEAEARMEEWYDEEFDELDPKTQRPTGKKITPHARYRIGVSVKGEKHETTLVSGPPKDAPGSLSLAESMQTQRPNTDQRPPPAREFAARQDPPLMVEEKSASTVADAPQPQSVVNQPEAASPADGTAELGAQTVAQPATGVVEPEQIDLVQAAPPPSAKRLS
jgi:hypothetical protein